MHDIPSFPVFARFRLEHITPYNEVYKHLKPFCDLSINDLLIWFDHNNDLTISALNGNFVLQFSNVFDDDEVNFVIVGNTRADDTIKKLFDFLQQNNFTQKITNTSSDFVEALSDEAKENLLVSLEEENKDYVFDVNKNVELQGGTYEKLRYKINHFNKNYGDRVRIEDVSLEHLANKKLIVNALHTWDRLYASNQELKIRYEGVAINKHLLLAAQIPVHCILVTVDDQLAGFSIYNRPPQTEYIIGNHIKCDYSFKYIFDYMYYATMLRCKELGVAYINGEQDLGDAGIRKHKEEMIPAFYLDRFTVTSRTRGTSNLVGQSV